MLFFMGSDSFLLLKDEVDAMSGTVSKKRSVLPFVILGIALVSLGLGLLYVKTRDQGNDQYASSGRGGQLRGFIRLKTPKEMPQIDFTDLQGKPFSLEAWKGRVVLLNIWATWCPPCRKEMPTLNRLQEELGSDDFEVVALSVDKAGPQVPAKYFKKYKFSALKVYNDKKIAVRRKLGIRGYPTTLLINRQGREVGRLAGPAEWDSDAFKTLIREIIAQK